MCDFGFGRTQDIGPNTRHGHGCQRDHTKTRINTHQQTDDVLGSICGGGANVIGGVESCVERRETKLFSKWSVVSSGVSYLITMFR